ncbi:MAG: hypothetical protein SGJ09_13555 [Phycisphaerae bacterium]|nr:hypothetical protein [Phycisphaerae bacterium]
MINHILDCLENTYSQLLSALLVKNSMSVSQLNDLFCVKVRDRSMLPQPDRFIPCMKLVGR